VAGAVAAAVGVAVLGDWFAQAASREAVARAAKRFVFMRTAN